MQLKYRLASHFKRSSGNSSCHLKLIKLLVAFGRDVQTNYNLNCVASRRALISDWSLLKRGSICNNILVAVSSYPQLLVKENFWKNEQCATYAGSLDLGANLARNIQHAWCSRWNCVWNTGVCSINSSISVVLLKKSQDEICRYLHWNQGTGTER